MLPMGEPSEMNELARNMGFERARRERENPTLNPRPFFNACSAMFYDTEFTIHHTLMNVFDSMAFTNTTLTSLKSIRYIILSQPGNTLDWSTSISVRLRFLEAAATSAVSLIYNVSLMAIAGIGALITGLQVKELNQYVWRFWSHTALAAISIGISVPAFVIPKSGLILNVLSFKLIGNYLTQAAQDDIINAIRIVYDRHKDNLKSSARESVNNNELYQSQVAPIFTFLDRRVPQLQTIGDIYTLYSDAERDFVQLRLLRTVITEGFQQRTQEVVQSNFSSIANSFSSFTNRNN